MVARTNSLNRLAFLHKTVRPIAKSRPSKTRTHQLASTLNDDDHGVKSSHNLPAACSKTRRKPTIRTTEDPTRDHYRSDSVMRMLGLVLHCL